MGLCGVQPLRNHGEQRHTFPTRDILRGPPADAGFAVLQAGVPSPGVPVLFPGFCIQPRERLFKGHGRGDKEDRVLARHHMAPAAQTANFPGPDSLIGRAPATVRCRNAGLRAHSAGPCSYCYAYCRAGACVSQRHTRAATPPPRLNPRSRCSGTWARGRRMYVCLVAREAKRAR